MSKPTTIESINGNLLRKVDPDGKLNLSVCLQCGRCSSGCTMRQETDIHPHQLNRMVALGLEDEILHSKAIWMCVSCNTCVSRCPMDVDTPALVDKLRAMAQDAPGDLKRVRTFNQTFLASVKRFGRAYELMLMGFYKLKSRDLFSDMDKFPTMLRKGKMAIFPPRTGGRGSVGKIFDRVRKARRAER